MTNTESIQVVNMNELSGSETEIMVCSCCRIRVANDDTSGCDDPETTASDVFVRWGDGYRFVIDADDEGEDEQWERDPLDCDLCGRSGCHDMMFYRALAIVVRG